RIVSSRHLPPDEINPTPPRGVVSPFSIYLASWLLRSQVPAEKDRNRIAYLVQNHPEHGAACPLDLRAGPCHGVPPGRAGPGHQNDAVAEDAREGTVGVSQDRRCIQKCIVISRWWRVKPKGEFRRTKERLLVSDRARARDDGESATSPGRRRRHVFRAHELGEIGSARREARGEARRAQVGVDEQHVEPAAGEALRELSHDLGATLAAVATREHQRLERLASGDNHQPLTQHGICEGYRTGCESLNGCDISSRDRDDRRIEDRRCRRRDDRRARNRPCGYAPVQRFEVRAHSCTCPPLSDRPDGLEGNRTTAPAITTLTSWISGLSRRTSPRKARLSASSPKSWCATARMLAPGGMLTVRCSPSPASSRAFLDGSLALDPAGAATATGAGGAAAAGGGSSGATSAAGAGAAGAGAAGSRAAMGACGGVAAATCAAPTVLSLDAGEPNRSALETSGTAAAAPKPTIRRQDHSVQRGSRRRAARRRRPGRRSSISAIASWATLRVTAGSLPPKANSKALWHRMFARRGMPRECRTMARRAVRSKRRSSPPTCFSRCRM